MFGFGFGIVGFFGLVGSGDDGIFVIRYGVVFVGVYFGIGCKLGYD